MASGLWDLNAHAEKLDTAAGGWTDVAAAVRDVADGVNTSSGGVLKAGWDGDAAESFDTHRKQLVGSIDSADAWAGRIATALGNAAGSVRAAQSHLDTEWAKVAGIPHTGGTGGSITFQTKDDDEKAKVDKAITAAQEIRRELDTQLARDTTTLRNAVAKWQQVSAKWANVAGGADAFDVPEGEDTVGVITIGDQTIINAGEGDDKIKIYDDPYRGDQIVEINGQVYRIPAGQDITVRGAGGNDTIEVPGDTHIDLTILGSDGDDSITGGGGNETILGLDGKDEVKAGAGDDRVSGGSGRDYVDGQDGNDNLSGGEGDDTVYGLGGDDTISGGSGRDYLEGAEGNDTVDGGADADIVSGGAGDDNLRGGGGDDVTYAGRGTDSTDAGSGNDTTYAESGDRTSGSEKTVTVEIPDTARFIKIEGSPEFVARVEADLEMLRSSPRGQLMLENLQQNHDDSGIAGIGRENLTIKEYFGDNNKASPGIFGGRGVEYNPSRDHSVDDRPPVVGLYHELAHIYDYMNGTSADGDYDGVDTQDHGIENDEREAAGLPIDHDDDTSTPERLDPDHPFDYTENGLRDELGWPEREHYSG